MMMESSSTMMMETSTADATSTSTAYGSGYTYWGGSGYNDCVQRKCVRSSGVSPHADGSLQNALLPTVLPPRPGRPRPPWAPTTAATPAALALVRPTRSSSPPPRVSSATSPSP